ncbi:hypothetical protein ES705_23605 [subsurface metagenome]
MNKENQVRELISEILNDKTQVERARFIKEIDAFMFTKNRDISDLEQEKLLREKDQQVYSVKVY